MEEPARIRQKTAAHPWLAAALALALISGASAAIHWLIQLDSDGRIANIPATLSEQTPITNVSRLMQDPAQKTYLGQQVALDRVRVEQVVGDYTFWIGDGSGHSLPVVLLGELTQRQPERVRQVEVGDTVRVFGVVRATRGASFLWRDAKLTEPERQHLLQSSIYVSAERVFVLP